MKRMFSFVVLAMTAISVSAQTVEIAPMAPVTRQVRSLVELTPSAERTQVRNLYGPVGYRLMWIRNSRPTAQALAVINLFENADAKGLNPLDYDGGRWQPRLAALAGDAALAEFEVAMTTSAMRYVSDLHTGRIDPHSVNFDLDADSKALYLPEVIWQVANANDPAAVLAQAEPQHDDYKRLLTALGTWRRIAADTSNDAPLPAVTKLSPKDNYEALPQLAAKLRAFGDLAADAQVEGTLYDGAIVDAVKHFQRRHGLDGDGIVSKKTFAQLNVPASQRVKQIELALERWRWTPAAPDGPSIIVNIPEFTLRARDERGELAMRVVVGKAAGHKTPVFDGGIRHVVFRPYWSVPPNIQRNEIVPHVERDRGYLARNNYEIVDDAGMSHGTSVNDETLRRLRTLQLQVRQKPGTSNALGLVKFLFPNDNNVYLHDTPSQSTFALARRDASHGCIRLEDPAALAAWALQWTPEKVRAAMNGEHNDDYVRPARPISVMILYATAVARENGEVAFFDDIYGHDVQLIAALDQRMTRPAQEKVLLAQAGASQFIPRADAGSSVPSR
jgi:murein L,D-transpeptidase YcbB/YkuD